MRSTSRLGRGMTWLGAAARRDRRRRFVISRQVPQRVTNTYYIYSKIFHKNSTGIAACTLSTGVSYTEVMLKIVGSRPVCTFLTRVSQGLYAYVLVHTDLYCDRNFISLYVLVHTGTYWYVLVHTSM